MLQKSPVRFREGDIKIAPLHRRLFAATRQAAQPQARDTRVIIPDKLLLEVMMNRNHPAARLPGLPDEPPRGITGIEYDRVETALLQHAVKKNKNEPLCIYISAEKDEKGQLQIRVEDNGEGMSDRRMQHF